MLCYWWGSAQETVVSHAKKASKHRGQHLQPAITLPSLARSQMDITIHKWLYAHLGWIMDWPICQVTPCYSPASSFRRGDVCNESCFTSLHLKICTRKPKWLRRIIKIASNMVVWGECTNSVPTPFKNGKYRFLLLFLAGMASEDCSQFLVSVKKGPLITYIHVTHMQYQFNDLLDWYSNHCS